MASESARSGRLGGHRPDSRVWAQGPTARWTRAPVQMSLLFVVFGHTGVALEPWQGIYIYLSYMMAAHRYRSAVEPVVPASPHDRNHYVQGIPCKQWLPLIHKAYTKPLYGFLLASPMVSACSMGSASPMVTFSFSHGGHRHRTFQQSIESGQSALGSWTVANLMSSYLA